MDVNDNIKLLELGRFTDKEAEQLGNYDHVKGTDWDPAWYFSFCSISEMKRAINPKNAKDILLRKRIEIIRDNVRYTRVFSSRKKNIKIIHWNLIFKLFIMFMC